MRYGPNCVPTASAASSSPRTAAAASSIGRSISTGALSCARSDSTSRRSSSSPALASARNAVALVPALARGPIHRDERLVASARNPCQLCPRSGRVYAQAREQSSADQRQRFDRCWASTTAIMVKSHGLLRPSQKSDSKTYSSFRYARMSARS